MGSAEIMMGEETGNWPKAHVIDLKKIKHDKAGRRNYFGLKILMHRGSTP